MPKAEDRVAFIIRGVVDGAMHDSRLAALRLVGARSSQSSLIERWCGRRFVDDRDALAVGSRNKTELLLNGVAEAADITPLGDLYASEVSLVGGAADLTGEAAEIALAAGGIERLDGYLRKLLDERYDADAAFAASPDLGPLVLERLEQTRFRLARAGVIPKIGARTIGIDLFL